METMQDNGIRKPFDPVLYIQTLIKVEWVKNIFPVLNVIPKQKEDFGIDSYWLRDDVNDLRNYVQSDILAGIEWERALASSWKSYIFPPRYDTVTFLPRKKHYSDLSYTCYFIRLNYEETNAYVTPIENKILKSEYLMDFRKSGSSIAKKGELRYEIPKDMVVFEFNYIEPFIICDYLEKNARLSNEEKNTMLNCFFRNRKEMGRPVPPDFLPIYKKRRGILKEPS